MNKDETNLNPPKKIIQPVFLSAVVLFSFIPLQINLTILGCGIGGGIGFFAMLFWGLSYPVWYPFAFFAILFFIGTPAVVYFIGKRTYDKTDYRFYSDYLEYTEGFWTIERKFIQYHHITQVLLQKSMVQRLYGVGTIYLAVPTMSQGKAIAGIKIADIKNPDSIYKEILEILSYSR